MSTTDQRIQAAAGIEQLAALTRAQSWRQDGTPSLPPTQAAVLKMLVGHVGLRAGVIATRLGISPASLSDTLRALEDKAWIKRVPDPADRRAAIVRLSAAGGRVAKQLSDPSLGLGALLGALGDHDVGALLRVTQLLVREAQQRGLATGPRTCIGCQFFRPHSTGLPDKPHHCAFVDAPFGDASLRVDCADQLPADDALLAKNTRIFQRAASTS